MYKSYSTAKGMISSLVLRLFHSESYICPLTVNALPFHRFKQPFRYDFLCIDSIANPNNLPACPAPIV